MERNALRPARRYGAILLAGRALQTESGELAGAAGRGAQRFDGFSGLELFGHILKKRKDHDRSTEYPLVLQRPTAF